MLFFVAPLNKKSLEDKTHPINTVEEMVQYIDTSTSDMITNTWIEESGIKMLGEILDKGIYEPSQHPKGKAVDLPLDQQTAQILYENSNYPKYESHDHYHISYR